MSIMNVTKRPLPILLPRKTANVIRNVAPYALGAIVTGMAILLRNYSEKHMLDMERWGVMGPHGLLNSVGLREEVINSIGKPKPFTFDWNA